MRISSPRVRKCSFVSVAAQNFHDLRGHPVTDFSRFWGADAATKSLLIGRLFNLTP
jgi:hypothetical protein